MIVLVRGDHEERIIRGDLVRCEPGEELAEGCVEFFELHDVVRLARAKRVVRIGRKIKVIAVVRVFDVAIDDRHARLEHCRQIAQRLRRRGIEAWKARVACPARPIRNGDAVEILDNHRGAMIERRCHIFVAEEGLEAIIAARLVRKLVGGGMCRAAAKRASLRSVDDDALEIGDR